MQRRLLAVAGLPPPSPPLWLPTSRCCGAMVGFGFNPGLSRPGLVVGLVCLTPLVPLWCGGGFWII